MTFVFGAKLGNFSSWIELILPEMCVKLELMTLMSKVMFQLWPSVIKYF